MGWDELRGKAWKEEDRGVETTGKRKKGKKTDNSNSVNASHRTTNGHEDEEMNKNERREKKMKR